MSTTCEDAPTLDPLEEGSLKIPTHSTRNFDSAIPYTASKAV